MKNMTFHFFVFFFISIFLTIPTLSSAEEMKTELFNLSVSVMDSTGTSKSSPNFNLLDAVGQPTPVGFSKTDFFVLKAGFIYGTTFSTPLDKIIPGIIDDLIVFRDDPSTPKQDEQKIKLAIKFLKDALKAWDLFEGGDADALANALNKTRNAINKLQDINDPAIDTQIHQELLAKASELAVNNKINEIAFNAAGGETNPDIIQARIFFSDGSTELLNAIYDTAVQSFVQAYNAALLAA